jgi:di/tricarboxylate transporter
LAAVVYALVRDLLAPAAAMLAATAVLLLTGVIDAQQAFSGFSNPAPITVALLYILAKAVSATGLLMPMVDRALQTGGSIRATLGRVLPPVVVASSVLNNTPIVAMMVPQISAWTARHGKSPSSYLMPLSFAAILGGTVTLIGTSTNLVVSGLLVAADYEPLSFFEITVVGLPVAIVGLALVIMLAPRVLPERASIRSDLGPAGREFIIDMLVSPAGPLDGETVEAGGLRNLAGVFLVEIVRGEEIVAPVRPDMALRGADRLRFAGRVDQVVDLMAIPGLASTESEQFEGFDTSRSSFFEVVVGESSPLVGNTLKGFRFRGYYQAAVVAIHRAGQRIDAKLGDVTVRVGDTLVLLADPRFRARWRDRSDFLLISPLGEVPLTPRRGGPIVAVATVGAIMLAATGLLPPLESVLLGAMVILAFRVLTPGEARDSIDLDVILTMAGGFGLAAAMEVSGLAETIASGLVSSFGSLGSIGALLGIVLATLVLTELVSNTAAALLMFPIAVSAAVELGLSDVRGFAIAVAVAASASFLTPIGYQTNTMVYGPGGYRYTDYARLGAPVSVAMTLIIVVTVPLFWPI